MDAAFSGEKLNGGFLCPADILVKILPNLKITKEVNPSDFISFSNFLLYLPYIKFLFLNFTAAIEDI